MNLYNIEIFDKDFNYKSSYQGQDVSLDFDYLSITNNKVKVKNINASKGDFIRVSSISNTIVSGIIKDCTEKKKEYEIEYKPLISLFDRTIYFDRELLKNTCIEEWLANIFAAYFKESNDVLQDIPMQISTSSTTMSKMELESNIFKLYDVITKTLITDDVVVDVGFDEEVKGIVIAIGKINKETFVIEADLPNVLDVEIRFKEAKESVNKLYIYNKIDESQYSIYYLTNKGQVTKTPSLEDRIEPVIFDSAFIEFDAEKTTDTTFEDEAFKKAEGTLVKSKYDNLIEITVAENDALVKPNDLEIGRTVIVVKDDVSYTTVLTGKKFKKNLCTLVFGSIRIELTKQLRRLNK